MTKTPWPLAAALGLALSASALADPVGYQIGGGNQNTQPVSPQTPLPVGISIMADAMFTSTASTSAYAAGQLIANSATADSVAPLSFQVCRNVAGTGMVRRARIKSADTGFAGATVRLHLYRSSPTVANGDHAAFSSTESEWLDDIDVTLDHAFNDPMEKGVGVPARGVEINYDCAAGSQVIYGLLEARGAITPVGAKAMTVILESLAN